MSESVATSAASATTAIFDSKDNKQEVSDVINNTSNNVDDDDASNDDDDNNVSNNDVSNIDVVFLDTQDIMNKVSRKVGMVTMEDNQFRSFFSTQMEIINIVWNMLEEGSLRPKKSKPKHLLWALYFLKIYPREGPRRFTVGGSKVAINPKTMRKWVWLILERIAKLAITWYVFMPHCILSAIVSPRCIDRCLKNHR
jgi:hypothetical protein